MMGSLVLMFAVALLAVPQATFARGGGNTSGCINTQIFNAFFGPRAEGALSSINVDYNVKPCDKAEDVRIRTTITSNTTGAVEFQYTDSILVGGSSTYLNSYTGDYTVKFEVLNIKKGTILETRTSVVSSAPSV